MFNRITAEMPVIVLICCVNVVLVLSVSLADTLSLTFLLEQLETNIFSVIM